MTGNYKEAAFETAIEQCLLEQGGYQKGSPDTFDLRYAEPHVNTLDVVLGLNGYQVYFWNEVEEFCRVFYKPAGKQSASDHAQMNACIDPAVSRFLKLEVEVREELRAVLAAYRSLYGFLSMIIPFQDSDLEKLYSYVRFLLGKLPRPPVGPIYRFDEEVSLKFYRLEKVCEGRIPLVPGEGGGVNGPTSVGTGSSHEEEIELSRLIDQLNERFSTDFKPAGQLFFDSIREYAVADEKLREFAAANTMEGFGYIFLKALEGLFIDRMEQNEELTARFLNDRDFKDIVGKNLLKQVYEQIRAERTMGDILD